MSQIKPELKTQEVVPFSPLNFRSKTMSQINVDDEKEEAFFSLTTSRRNPMPQITAVDDKTQDALPFSSPPFSPPRKSATNTPALSYFNLLKLNCRVPCKVYKRHHKLISIWNKEVVLSSHPKLLRPTPKQIALNTLDDLDFDISALNAKLAPLIEAERLVSAKGFCQIGKVNGLAFAGALALPVEQREEEIKFLERQINRLHGEYIALYAGAFDSDESHDGPIFEDDGLNVENGVELGGPFLDDELGSVR